MIETCPSCDKPLVAFVYGDVEIDSCPDCGGLWLDEGEFAELAEDSGHDGRPTDQLLAELAVPGIPPPGKARICPRCERPMVEITLPALAHCPATHLDRCPFGHGLFFDRHELPAVVCRHHGQDSPLSRYLMDFFGPDFFSQCSQFLTSPSQQNPEL